MRSAEKIRHLAAKDLGFDVPNITQVQSDPVRSVINTTAIAVDRNLLGINIQVYDDINRAIKAGKRHLLLYGPPGTGKTTIAKHIARLLAPDEEPLLLTGSSDWTAQDLIGGYMPIGKGEIAFAPGLLLQNFDRLCIIDELNRCDIDKVIGPLFSVLAGDDTTLPYFTDPTDVSSDRYVILANEKDDLETNEFAPTNDWRLVATLNTVDKSALYQLSYALMRRFAWIFVDVPENLQSFIKLYCAQRNWPMPDPDADAPIATVWNLINEVRKIGPAPFLDILSYCYAADENFKIFEVPTSSSAEIYVGALRSFVIPMLDGMLRSEGDKLFRDIAAALHLETDSPAAEALRRSLHEISA